MVLRVPALLLILALAGGHTLCLAAVLAGPTGQPPCHAQTSTASPDSAPTVPEMDCCPACDVYLTVHSPVPDVGDAWAALAPTAPAWRLAPSGVTRSRVDRPPDRRALPYAQSNPPLLI